jgi:hypothetical protein
MTRKLSTIVLLALLGGAPLAASSVRPVSFDTLSRTAKRVISGKIVKVESDVDANGFIYSNVTMIVRNAAPRSLEGRPYTFRTIGGEVDGRRLTVQGMPRFEVGQQVALFLHDSPGTALGPTVGLWQGVFFVERDAATGKEVMVDSSHRALLGFEGAELLRGSKAPQSADRTTGLTLEDGSRAMGVDAFFEKVRAYRGAEGF